MKVIFYVAATCGNIDFHFIANLEHQFVITRSLTTLFWSLYLLHMERERLQTSGVRLEICYLHTAPPVKVLNQASPQHLSANETLSLHLYTIYCFITVCVCSFVFDLIILNLHCSFEHIAADLESLFDVYNHRLHCIFFKQMVSFHRIAQYRYVYCAQYANVVYFYNTVHE